jgi:probable F420-dependent oxidoreductase
MSERAALQFGAILPTRETVMSGNNDPAPLLEMATRAEEAGFDSVWVGDSLFRSARFDPLTLLAAIATRTERVSVGSAVLVAPLRHPFLLAQSLATIDRLAQGRLILGLGAGWLEDEFSAVGVPFNERVGRLAETIKICRALWTGQPTSFAGKYWNFTDIEMRPVPTEPGGPPIWLGGFGPMALRVAGRYGDGWFPTSPTPEAFAQGWEIVVERAAAEGRDPAGLTPAAYLNINLDPAGGTDEMDTYAQSYYGLPFSVMSQVQGYFAGSTEECIDWLAGFVEAGVRHIVLRFATMDPLPHFERAAAEVIPGLKARFAADPT